MKITAKSTIEQIAAAVVEKLKEKKISAVLVGGAVVSIYTENRYQSRDLDFISSGDHATIAEAMRELGFDTSTKDFTHPDTDFTVEFPTGPLAIGDEEPVKPEGSLSVGKTKIKMFSPTQSVMDRLIWFYSTNDRQCLDQAVWIARLHPVNLARVRKWSVKERFEEKFEVFLRRLNSSRATES